MVQGILSTFWCSAAIFVVIVYICYNVWSFAQCVFVCVCETQLLQSFWFIDCAIC